mmetsp:Transcript_12469/g.14488  ORF Transcript_12469/g.14488 Transcript_12469/m.14488 type:complete len:198 (+) Transcript_12469:439-1032(+)
MHSAKCGDANNLNVVLDMYTYVFGTLSSMEDEIDWVNVDFKVKKLVSDKVFAGNATPISNYTSSRSRRKRSMRKAPAAAAVRRKQDSNRAHEDDATAKSAARSINTTTDTTTTADTTTDTNTSTLKASHPVTPRGSSTQGPAPVTPATTQQGDAPDLATVTVTKSEEDETVMGGEVTSSIPIHKPPNILLLRPYLTS